MNLIPEQIMMKAKAFGDGPNGAAIQIRRNDEFGVEEVSVRADNASEFVTTFTSDFLFDREFTSFDLLRAAVAEAHAEGRLRVFSPVVIDVKTKDPRSSGHCYLCRGIWTKTVYAQLRWTPGSLDFIPTCDLCEEQTKADPVAAIAARIKWCRENPFTLKAANDDADDMPF